MLFMEILVSRERREHMQTKTETKQHHSSSNIQEQTGTESKLIWLLTCVGVGILSGYVIINHVIWTWSRQSHRGMRDFKHSKAGSSTKQNEMFKRKASAVSASSKEQGRKYAGIGPKAGFLCMGKYVSLAIAFFPSDKDFLSYFPSMPCWQDLLPI